MKNIYDNDIAEATDAAATFALWFFIGRCVIFPILLFFVAGWAHTYHANLVVERQAPNCFDDCMYPEYNSIQSQD